MARILLDGFVRSPTPPVDLHETAAGLPDRWRIFVESVSKGYIKVHVDRGENYVSERVFEPGDFDQVVAWLKGLGQ